tara:strand:- start:294 stop:1046 length:753 start_codon:yes stop_codon:yes gene_type:complete
VLRVLDLFSGAKWYYREWVTIALTNPFSALFWVWIFHKIINKQSFTSLGLKLSGYKDDFIEGLLLGFGLTGLGFGVLYVFDFLLVEQVKFSLNNHLLYVFVFALVALGEEIAIRGFILQNLASSFNKYIALVLSSFAFVYIRGWNNIDFGIVAGIPSPWAIVSLLNLFLVGILLGLYCFYKNNLWFPIGVNFSWSYFKTPVCGFKEYDFGTNETIIRQNLRVSDFEGSILFTVLIIAGIVFVHRRYSSSS